MQKSSQRHLKGITSDVCSTEEETPHKIAEMTFGELYVPLIGHENVRHYRWSPLTGNQGFSSVPDNTCKGDMGNFQVEDFILGTHLVAAMAAAGDFLGGVVHGLNYAIIRSNIYGLLPLSCGLW